MVQSNREAGSAREIRSEDKSKEYIRVIGLWLSLLIKNLIWGFIQDLIVGGKTNRNNPSKMIFNDIYSYIFSYSSDKETQFPKEFTEVS